MVFFHPKYPEFRSVGHCQFFHFHDNTECSAFWKSTAEIRSKHWSNLLFVAYIWGCGWFFHWSPSWRLSGFAIPSSLFALLLVWMVQKVSNPPSSSWFTRENSRSSGQTSLLPRAQQMQVLDSPVEYCSVCYPSVMGATGTKEPPAALSTAWAERWTRIFPTADGSSPLSLFRAHNTSVSSPERVK